MIFIFTISNTITPTCTDFIIWINNTKILLMYCRIGRGDYPLVNVHSSHIITVLKWLLLQSYIIAIMQWDSWILCMVLSEWSASDYSSLLVATFSAQRPIGLRALYLVHPFCNCVGQVTAVFHVELLGFVFLFVEKFKKKNKKFWFFLKRSRFGLTRQVTNTHSQN